jgi:small GTP-binding protein
MGLPIVAVVGRPNVGKSTLVNRIAQSSEAIVHEARGVTRDRSYHRADWNGVDFLLIDTGGIEAGSRDDFQTSIRDQALLAAGEADVVVLLVDGSVGPTADDEQVAALLKRAGTPALLAVNKLDTPGREEAVHDFWGLGLGQPWPISATHGHGTGDLLDEVVRGLPSSAEQLDHDTIDVSIIGRPNAGKSSLLNALTGIERAIVSEVPGTTRDAIDTVVERDGVRYRLVDTAGLRRKAVIDGDVEYFGFGLTDQDQRIARFAEERGCALVVLLNKWDAIEQEEKDALETRISERLGFVGYAPVLRTSALTGRGVGRIWNVVDVVFGNYTRAVPTSALNRLLTEMREFGHTVSKGRQTLRLHYATQTRTAPPGFTFFANHPRLADDNFKRYLENRLRERFDLAGTPVLLKFRPKD